eukprot:490499-Amphidinium_carterae.1
MGMLCTAAAGEATPIASCGITRLVSTWVADLRTNIWEEANKNFLQSLSLIMVMFCADILTHRELILMIQRAHCATFVQLPVFGCSQNVFNLRRFSLHLLEFGALRKETSPGSHNYRYEVGRSSARQSGNTILRNTKLWACNLGASRLTVKQAKVSVEPLLLSPYLLCLALGAAPPEILTDDAVSWFSFFAAYLAYRVGGGESPF